MPICNDGACGGVNPVVTVVVPVYNAERFLVQRLDTLVNQTLREIEIICVDDGSTDASSDILRTYAEGDARVRVVSQENAGPAVARNRGIELARGRYVTSFDADDYCDMDLLAHVMARVDRALASGSLVDVAVFPESSHNERTGAGERLGYAFQTQYFPDGVFTWRACPDRIFSSFQNWLHNKLFRTAFVRENGLLLQELHHTEDLLFTCSALVKAQGILCVDGRCAYYRIGLPNSQLHATSAWPLDFYQACCGLHDFLEAEGVMAEMRCGYINWVSDCVLSNIDLMRDPAGMRLIYDTLHGAGLERIGLTGATRQDFFDDDAWKRIDRLAHADYDTFIVGEHADMFNRWHDTFEDMVAVTSSRSFAVGRAITGIPRKLRDCLGARRSG